MRDHVNTVSMRAAALGAMCALPIAAAVAQSADHPPNTLTAAEQAAGWALLFDGESTEHWRGYRKDAFPERGWEVDEGAIRVIASGGGGDIITKSQYENFELVLEFRLAPRANSGIMYRVRETETNPWQTGPEYQVLDDAGNNLAPDDNHSTGAIYDLYTPDPQKQMKPQGEWNLARIRLRDGLLTHWLNGAKLLEVDLNGEEWRSRIAGSKFAPYENFGRNESGHICLQDHGNDVWFRNIKVRDLDQAMPGEVALFTNETAWEFVTNGGRFANTFDLEDGVLICTGAPVGYVRTKEDYGNFVLKLEWRYDAEKGAGNSGVLIRMTGEDKVWPKSLEAQLLSGSAGDLLGIDGFVFKGDPARTNGRHTRKTHAAERPVGEWNEYEIIADGGSLVLFVNGEKVNEASDVAQAPGKICLQSEGAHIEFGNIRLAPIKR